MLFTEPLFFAFYAVVFALSWTIDRNRGRKLVLLAASYFFYAAWDVRFLSLILASTAVDFFVARAIARATVERKRKWLLVSSLVFNLGLLGVFKYFKFFVESAAALLDPLGLELGDRALAIVLPVGISFYTFQTMSYTIDVFRRRLEPVEDPFDFALFVGFFPQLVAGPIVRAAHFLPQLDRRPRFGDLDVRRYLALFLIGFVKKACIADAVAPHVDRVFAHPEAFTAASVWLAVALYAVQIYGDFSGYTDMAIACAGLLGYDLGKNFNAPYLAVSLADFWRRWHISLSSWLRDYLFIPLGGSHGSRFLTARNLMLTMLLGGLWHGAAWTFVAWGALHGAGLAIHRLWRRIVADRVEVPPALRPFARLAAMALTLWIVCCGWILFRARSFADAATLLDAFVFLDALGPLELDRHLWGLVAGLTGAHVLAAREGPRRLASRLPEPAFAAAYGVATAVALAFVRLRAEPFIYFQF